MATAIANNNEERALALLEGAGRQEVMAVVKCPWRGKPKDQCPNQHRLEFETVRKWVHTKGGTDLVSMLRAFFTCSIGILRG